MRYADVIVDISHEKLDKVYQYAIPSEYEGMALVGLRVEIPFGHRIITGYIVNITDKPAIDIERIKPIIKVVDKQVGIDERMIKVAYYIRNMYGATINDALKTVLPVKKVIKNNNKRILSLSVDEGLYEELIEKYKNSQKYQARYRLLCAIHEQGRINEEYAVSKLSVSKSIIKKMEEEGYVSVASEISYRNPVGEREDLSYNITLNEEQKHIADTIKNDYDHDIKKTYLIHGVTGSGKTEVYMDIIDHVVKKGKQVIVLIPEIALTYQTVKRFYEKFKNRVSVMNSRLSDGERYDQYLRAKNSDIDIIIGPRSALFTPFENLGLIIIDEEHEGSYKSEMPPKYDARQVAIYMASLCGASVILGSATPSVTSYYNVQMGKYKLFELNKRANNAHYPKVYVEDLREEMKAGNKSIFSRRLKGLIEDRLRKKEQVMLFINRRGYSGFVSCRSCGYIVKCPHCDVSMTYHGSTDEYYGSQKEKMVCHYCGYEMPAFNRCPKCSSSFIALFGTGTQKVEQLTKKEFPEAGILRMDADTTKAKNGHEKILSEFSKGKADILIGTQMIVKGHDFANVTLVGILAADLSLGTSDYNAAETTYSLLVQAAGRAGRGNRPGEVVIQTYKPDHYSIVTAKNNDYKSFYKQEIISRKLSMYPPVGKMLCILIMSSNKEKVSVLANVIKERSHYEEEGIVVLGPTDALIGKINDYYRKVIYIKSTDINKIIQIRDDIQEYVMSEKRFNDCIVHYDINPMHCQ